MESSGEIDVRRRGGSPTMDAFDGAMIPARHPDSANVTWEKKKGITPLSPQLAESSGRIEPTAPSQLLAAAMVAKKDGRWQRRSGVAASTIIHSQDVP